MKKTNLAAGVTAGKTKPCDRTNVFVLVFAVRRVGSGKNSEVFLRKNRSNVGVIRQFEHYISAGQTSLFKVDSEQLYLQVRCTCRRLAGPAQKYSTQIYIFVNACLTNFRFLNALIFFSVRYLEGVFFSTVYEN